MSNTLRPKKIQTIEKYDDIYYEYQELNMKLKMFDPEFAKEASQAYRYRVLAEKFHMAPKTIGTIIRFKLTEHAGERTTIQAAK